MGRAEGMVWLDSHAIGQSCLVHFYDQPILTAMRLPSGFSCSLTEARYHEAFIYYIISPHTNYNPLS